jgi:hypothetical protein
MKTLISHVGLGDSILLSGAAVELAKRHGKLRVPAYAQYLESVKSFYVNHPEIEVYSVDNPEGSHWGCPPVTCFEVIGEPIYCGLYANAIGAKSASFPEWFYRQLGVDYSHRWDSCPIQNAWEKSGPIVLKTNEVFVHDDAERGFNITKGIPEGVFFRPMNPIFKIKSGSFASSLSALGILQYSFAIAQAAEVHVIDSCFYHLAESLDTFGQLFLHRYARSYSSPWNDYPTRKKWNIVT